MATREELALAVDEAEWEWLRPHLDRDAVIIIAADLDIVDAGLRISADDAGAVEDWIATEKLRKPTGEEIALWNREKKKRFSILIVSPYILIKEKT